MNGLTPGKNNPSCTSCHNAWLDRCCYWFSQAMLLNLLGLEAKGLEISQKTGWKMTGWSFGTMFFFWFSIQFGNFIIPFDEVIFFRGVGISPTRWPQNHPQSTGSSKNPNMAMFRHSEGPSLGNVGFGKSTRNGMAMWIFAPRHQMIFQALAWANVLFGHVMQPLNQNKPGPLPAV